MKIKFWSKSKIGKLASIFTALFIVLMCLKLSPLSALVRLPFPTPFIALLGLIGSVLGVISVFKNKEKAIILILSISIGLLIFLWTIAEIVM